MLLKFILYLIYMSQGTCIKRTSLNLVIKINDLSIKKRHEFGQTLGDDEGLGSWYATFHRVMQRWAQ